MKGVQDLAGFHVVYVPSIVSCLYTVSVACAFRGRPVYWPGTCIFLLIGSKTGFKGSRPDREICPSSCSPSPPSNFEMASRSISRAIFWKNGVVCRVRHVRRTVRGTGKSRIWDATYDSGEPSPATELEPAEMPTARCGTKDTIRGLLHLLAWQSFACGHLSRQLSEYGPDHNRSLTGSSSAWIARNGTLMASTESIEDASR